VAPKKFWILKSEPDSFSIDDLERVGTTSWDGVRNYQARNYLRAQRKGDRVLFYHSSCAEPGVVGIAEIARVAYPDDSAFDPDDKHYDPKSDPSDPTWYMPDVKFVRKLPRVVTLHELQGRPELEGLLLTRKGNRLSVMPATKEHFDFIVALAGRSRTVSGRPAR
jgi:predicted RNA-binding protein with PUA-like domain